MEHPEHATEINMSHIPVSGDAPGLLFTLATVMIFFWGIPELRCLVPMAILLGAGIALALHFIPQGRTVAPWIPRTDKFAAVKSQ